MTTVDWDHRWREKAEHPHCADPWLFKILPLLPKGRILDVACGRGRNAVYLAEQGHAIHAIDYSDEGVSQLRSVAASRQLDITAETVDLEHSPALPSATYDIVIVFFYLQRTLFPALMQSVRPGGIMVVRTFSRAGDFPGSPRRKEFVLAPGELLQIFTGWDILLHEEGLEASSKGGSLAGIVARRPSSQNWEPHA
jgi:SAM-dependent methyltransferase